MEVKQIMEAFSPTLTPCQDANDPKEWARLGFFVSLQLIKTIREERLSIQEMQAHFKEDGSPFTRFEKSIEDFCKKTLEGFYPDGGFVGEESGSEVQHETQILFVIDPIDGTRSFLSGFDTFSTTISIVKGKEIFFSIISSPGTGDMAFRVGTDPSQLISLPIGTEEWQMGNLPLFSPKPENAILVNIHPAKVSKPYLDKMFALWDKGQIALVKSVSGSPSLQIIETCKGDVFYFNVWHTGITMPYDLVAALHILEGAGGATLNMKGEIVDPWAHSGPFLAGINRPKMEFLLNELVLL